MQSYLSYNEIKKWLEAGEDGAAEDSAAEDSAAEDSAAEDSAAEDSAAEDSAAEDSAAEDSAAEDGNNHFDVINVNQDSELIEDPEDPAALGMALCLILVQNLLF